MSIDLLDIKNEAKVTVIEEEAAKKDKNDSKTNTTCERTDDLKPEDTGEEDNITVNNSEVMAGNPNNDDLIVNVIVEDMFESE